MARATTSSNTSLLPCDSKCSFQHWSFCITLCFTLAKVFLSDFPIIEGRSRYFSWCWLLEAPQSLLIACWVLLGKCLLKDIVVLFALISYHDAAVYLFNSCCIVYFLPLLLCKKANHHQKILYGWSLVLFEKFLDH